jgi:uncharacterized protein YecT (DUF1311 family)
MLARRFLLSLLLLAPLLPATAHAQNTSSADPCAKAVSQVDMNACYNGEYKKADARLNSIYRKALASLQSSKTALVDLKAAEFAWIKYRDAHCQAAGKQYEGGSIRPMIESQCMQLVTQHRIEEIKQAYENGDIKLE